MLIEAGDDLLLSSLLRGKPQLCPSLSRAVLLPRKGVRNT